MAVYIKAALSSINGHATGPLKKEEPGRMTRIFLRRRRGLTALIFSALPKSAGERLSTRARNVQALRQRHQAPERRPSSNRRRGRRALTLVREVRVLREGLAAVEDEVDVLNSPYTFEVNADAVCLEPVIAAA